MFGWTWVFASCASPVELLGRRGFLVKAEEQGEAGKLLYR